MWFSLLLFKLWWWSIYLSVIPQKTILWWLKGFVISTINLILFSTSLYFMTTQHLLFKSLCLIVINLDTDKKFLIYLLIPNVLEKRSLSLTLQLDGLYKLAKLCLQKIWSTVVVTLFINNGVCVNQILVLCLIPYDPWTLEIIIYWCLDFPILKFHFFLS